MIDTPQLIALGNSIGFTIDPRILEDLGLKKGDLIQVEIMEQYQDKEFIKITRPLTTIGGGSTGIIIKSHIVRALHLEKGKLLQVDLTVPEV